MCVSTITQRVCILNCVPRPTHHVKWATHFSVGLAMERAYEEEEALFLPACMLCVSDGDSSAVLVLHCIEVVRRP